MENCRLPCPPSKSQKIDMEGPFRLLYFSSKGDMDGVMQEIEKGVSPNLADNDKRTALHLASCEGYTEVVNVLLEKGADVNSIDCWGHTPLSDARNFCNEKMCEILKEHGGAEPVGLDSIKPCYEIHHTEVDMDDAIIIEEGAYSEVYLVKWRGTEVAAKTIRSSIASNDRVKSTFMKEIALWQRLRHPNIVQFLGVLNHSGRSVFLTEYLPNGSLYDILKRKGRLDLPTTVAFALDIARGMNYLHQHKPHEIIHRNLTPRFKRVLLSMFSLMLTRTAILLFFYNLCRNVLQDEAGHLKVMNFELGKTAQEKGSYAYKMTGGTGSFRYLAPEVYRREAYGKSVDVFSFAMIVHEMFQGRPSNMAESAEKVADRRAYEDTRPSLSSFIFPEEIKILLRRSWHKNPESRPSFEEIITELEILQDSLDIKACCWTLF